MESEASSFSSSSNTDTIIYQLDNEQYEGISSTLEEIKQNQEYILQHQSSIDNKTTSLSNLSNLSEISSNVSSIRSNQSNAETLQDLPEDYYNTTLDLQSQIVFFLSLILGIFVCYMFICNFVKK